MRMIKRNRNIILLMASSFLLAVLPATTIAQGRSRLHRRDMSWKCRVFVNCHDARDGRLDGRGPRANRVAFRNRVFAPSNRRRFRNFDRQEFRNLDREDRFRGRRIRARDRDFDNGELFRQNRIREADRGFRADDMFRGRGFGRGPGRRGRP